MAKEILKDVTIRNAKATDKDQRLNDGEGLYIIIKSNGAKWWRFDYTFAGKRKTLSVGVYPATGLGDARRKAETTRANVSNGIDPSNTRKETKVAQQVAKENESRLDAGLTIINSFEHIAREWGEKKIDTWADKSNRSRRMLERNIFPWLGSKAITDILPMDILICLRLIEDRGTIETAHRTLQLCGQVFRYAVATGRIDRDITPDLRGALAPAKGGNFASITDPKEAALLLRAIDDYTGSFIVKSALQLAPLVFVRPGELRRAEWEHVDLDAKEWRYLVTKTQTPHIVPLSKQAIEILTNLRPLTGNGRFVFPSARTPNGSRAMSDVALLAALRRMGFDKTEMTVHGFRAMARTILDEVLGFRPDFIEHQLAHAVRDANGRSYNRTSHLPERHKMMQSWSDYLDGLKNGAQVIPFKKIV
ncbi:integrase arm-type DNA-binding domain-containing protein [Methylobacter sp. S3L5C]|uniref:tyrosine-type recombinase/integrase n=1 Tax=Methylobacter sp. S3L5C TaxID=2839024 RepID=UPI001FABD086|nr:integrase arm-type DNA-binding domain-containing protein [Methylobacter sp. S3L5C]UOA08579.1 integrase arm-type DNA-binding domain-containing protein [Methylobacter sp. S3L5C]